MFALFGGVEGNRQENPRFFWGVPLHKGHSGYPLLVG